MKKKLLLYPNNVSIFIKSNYLFIKGPFKTFKLPLVQDNFYNLMYNFKTIDFIKSSKDFNILKLTYVLNSNKYFINYFINLLKKYIELASIGYLNILQLWGIGYKITKKNHISLLNLGYSHSLCILDKNFVYSKPIDNIYIFNTSTSKHKLLETTAFYKKLRKKDVYKGKGIRKLHEKINLKIGKRD